MKTIKVLIVEDEMIIANDVAHYIKDMGCEICKILMTGEEALDFLEHTIPTIILMDIALKGKLDGIETVTQINKKHDIPIIYMTANSDDHSFARAKATGPFAFVEKPFKKRLLTRTIDLLIEHLIKKDQKQDYQELIPYALNDRIFVRDQNALIKIFIKDILIVQAERAYCNVKTAEKSYVLSTNLKSFEEKINTSFLRRIHRSYIINLKQIDKIEDNHVSINGERYPVSKAYWNDLSKAIKVI